MVYLVQWPREKQMFLPWSAGVRHSKYEAADTVTVQMGLIINHLQNAPDLKVVVLLVRCHQFKVDQYLIRQSFAFEQ